MIPEHSIPGPFPIKIIARNNADIRSQVLQAVQTIFPKCSNDLMRETASGGNKYLSFTVTVHVDTEEQLKELNKKLRANPDVMTVL